MYKINCENEEINNNQKYQNIEDSEIELTHAKKNSEKITIKNEKSNEVNNSKIFSQKSIKNNFSSNIADFKTERNLYQDKIKDINYFETINRLNYNDIILSYLCCKNNNSKLINLCDELLQEDLCLENILSRIYELENVINILLKIELINYNVNVHEKFKEISKCIYKIEKEKLNKKE